MIVSKFLLRLTLIVFRSLGIYFSHQRQATSMAVTFKIITIRNNTLIMICT